MNTRFYLNNAVAGRAASMQWRRLISVLFFLLLLPIPPALADQAKDGDGSIVPSDNRVLRLTDDGIYPREVVIHRAGSSLFVLNDTSESLVGIEVDYGDHLGFCATGTVRMDDDGFLRSRKPFPPRSFITVCFPQQGTYPLRVYGLKTNPNGETGKVIVE